MKFKSFVAIFVLKMQFFIVEMQNINNLIGLNSEHIFDIFNSCSADVNQWNVKRMSCATVGKKVALFPEIGRVKVFYHLLVHIVKCV